MLRFRFLGFPVTIEPFFWLGAAFVGGAMQLGSRSGGANALLLVALKMGVVFLSILVHELGHALTNRKFGRESEILLHGMGGLCISQGRQFSRGQSIMVSAAGPAAGMLLGLVFFLVLNFAQLPIAAASPILYLAIRFGVTVNFFWSLFNLLPILPMDGGHIFRDVMGPRRYRTVCIVGAVLAVGIAVLAVMHHQYIIAILMGALAFMNFKGVPPAGGVETAGGR